MDRSLSWFDLATDHGVLELHEALTAPGPVLELHVVQDAETGATIAWWANDRGEWVWEARVGSA